MLVSVIAGATVVCPGGGGIGVLTLPSREGSYILLIIIKEWGLRVSVEGRI